MEQLGGKKVSHATKLKVKHVEYRPPNSRIPGHNFAIGLLQTMESRMDDLRADFQAHGSRHNHYAVDKNTFQKMLLKRVKQGPKSVLETSWLKDIDDEILLSNIGAVFEGVASTGKSTINFDELMTYVINCSMAGKVGHVDERVPEYEESGCAILKNLEEITRSKYCPELGKILCAGKSIGLVDSATMQTRTFPITTDPKDRVTCVYDIDYVPHLNAAIVVGSEMSIHLFGLDKGKRLFTIPTNETHQVVAFDRTTSLAIVAMRNGDLATYKLPSHRGSEAKFEEGVRMRHHSQTILRILPLEKDGLVAASSADSSVSIHDSATGSILTQFVGHFNGGGVRTICHMSHLNLMASCAYDTEPLVWMISTAATRSDAFVLSDNEMPHIGHVVDMCCVPNSPQLTSMDIHGLIKVWDLRMFRCVQTIRADKIVTGVVDTNRMKWHSCVWDESISEICIMSRRRIQKLTRKIPLKELEAVSSTTNTKRNTTARSDATAFSDEYPILCLTLNLATQTVITCSEQKVRVWDAFTGRQEVLFDRLGSGGASPISCLCVNDTGKVFFLGHKGGRLMSHAFSTGTPIFKFVDDGATEVLSLTYMTGTNAFAAVTWNGCKVYYDNAAYHDGVQSFYPDSSRSIEVKTVHWDPVLSILTVGERTGTVCLWESRQNRFTPDSVRSIGSMEVGDAEVNAVHLLTGSSAVAIADNVGRLVLFTTMPHPFPNRKFAEMLLKGREIVSLVYYPPRRLLYCADDKGSILVVDVANALASVGVTTASDSWETLMNNVGRKGTAPSEVVDLKPARSVQAHSDVITGLQWIPGTSLLFSSSIDRHALVWTLALELRGCFDPLTVTGTYEAPFAKSIGNNFVHEIPFDEDLWNTEYTPEKVKAKAQDDSKSPKEEVTVTLTTAAKFDEEIRKAAIELETILKEKTTSRSKEKAQAILKMDGDTETERSKNWKFEAVVKELDGSSPKTQFNPKIQGLDPEGATRDVYSVNSSGVECHSLLTPQPDALQFYRKKHIVERSAPEQDKNSEAIPFEVTRDFPLPPNARAERDFLLRQMKDNEELLEQKARSAENENPYLVSISGAKIDVSESGFAPLPEVRSSTSHMMRRGGRNSRNSQQQRNSMLHRRSMASPAERALGSLLPSELISLKKTPKRGNVGAKITASLVEAQHRRSQSTPPVLMMNQSNSHQFVDDVDWNIQSSGTAGGGGGGQHYHQNDISEDCINAHHQTSSFQQASRRRPPHHVVERLPALVDDDEETREQEVGFLTFGVRSLNDRLLTPASGSPFSGTRSFNGTFQSSDGRMSSWRKTHRVDM